MNKKGIVLSAVAFLLVAGCDPKPSEDTTASVDVAPTPTASSGGTTSEPDKMGAGTDKAAGSTDKMATGKDVTPGAKMGPTAPPTKEITTASGLKYEDVKVGTGAEAKAGQRVSVHYTGTLTDGTKFDSSRDRNEPFAFTLGAGEVIPGWDEGVAGMKVGGQRKLTIPANLGYGDRGAGSDIPPGATLKFDVELMGVQ